MQELEPALVQEPALAQELALVQELVQEPVLVQEPALVQEPVLVQELAQAPERALVLGSYVCWHQAFWRFGQTRCLHVSRRNRTGNEPPRMPTR